MESCGTVSFVMGAFGFVSFVLTPKESWHDKLAEKKRALSPTLFESVQETFYQNVYSFDSIEHQLEIYKTTYSFTIHAQLSSY